MFQFFKRRKYRREVMSHLHAYLVFYPTGVKRIAKNYPNLGSAIDSNFESGDTNAAYSTLICAGSILANEFGALDQPDRDAIYQQLTTMDFNKFKAALRGEMKLPENYLHGTSLAAVAFLMADQSFKSGDITENQFDNFKSELLGSLQGKTFAQRSEERVRDAIDSTIGPPPLLEGPNDNTRIFPSQRAPYDDPELNGVEWDVELVPTATGLAIVRREDGKEVTQRRSLTQGDLQSVPGADRGKCRFVNIRTRSGEIESCLMYGADNEVVGSRRAFWWALAKVTVKMTDAKASGMRMSERALARVHSDAREVWDAVIKRVGSIDNLRDEPVFERNKHFDVHLQLIDQADTPASELGIKISQAMVLATGAEDAKLEAHAYHRFKRFLWRPGEEPEEFYSHEN